MELMLELSGSSRQAVLVVKACATTKDFEGVAKVLVDQYGRDPSLGMAALSPHNRMGSLVKGMEVPKDHKVVKVPTRQPTTPIPMRKATVSMMKSKRNTMKKMHRM